MKKGTVTVERFTRQPMTLTRKLVLFGSVTLPLLASSAFAVVDPALTSMSGDATAGVDAIKLAVVGLVGVIVTIGLLIWGSRHLKPKG